MPRSLLGLALAVAVLACGLLLLRPWAPAPDGTASDRESVDPAVALRSQGPVTVQPDPRPPVVLRGTPPADRPLAPDEGGLYGLVLDAGMGTPVPGVTVHALRLDWYHAKFALLAFSCRTRNLCPSCQTKRSAVFAVWVT